MTRLGWSPETFWAATPADLLMALTALGGGASVPMRHDEFATLCRRFPDRPVDDSRGEKR